MTQAVLITNDKSAPNPFAALKPVVLASPDPVRLANVGANAVWIVWKAHDLRAFIPFFATKAVAQNSVLILDSSFERLNLLNAVFKRVVAEGHGTHLLPHGDLIDVLGSPRPEDLLIGYSLDKEDETIVFHRGNFETLVVPFDFFRAKGSRPRPNFNDCTIIDCGQTVRLGTYEAATDAILYELDADFRRRMKRKERVGDKSFGACLRRLRLQKGLKLQDFTPHVAERQMGRIERNEIANPRPETLRKIARRLGVRVGDITSY